MTDAPDLSTLQLSADAAIARIYSPLKTQNEIRLLTLHRGYKGEPLKCTLNAVKLEPVPRYEALSYVWGDPGSEQEIFLNGESVFIRRNLWQYLEHLRLEDGERVVWVDALCISQTDLEEKAQQVRQIGTIFSKARKVNAWLGDIYVSFTSLKKTVSQILSHRGASMVRFRTDLLESLPEMSDVLLAPYWDRTWIVQEIISAQVFHMYCNDNVVPWDDLIDACTAFRRILDQQKPTESALIESRLTQKIDYILNLSSRRQSFQAIRHQKPTMHIERKSTPTSRGTPILSSVQDFLSTACYDPRDKIYSLLFVTSDELNPSGIEVDYLVRPEELYLHVLEQSQPIKSAREAEMLRRSMNLSWDALSSTPVIRKKSKLNKAYNNSFLSGFLRAKNDSVPDTDVAMSTVEPTEFVPRDFWVEAKLRYVGKIYDTCNAKMSKENSNSDDSRITVFRNILAAESKFTVFQTLCKVELEQELWQVALSPLVLITGSKDEDLKDVYADRWISGGRSCRGVALVTSNPWYTRPFSTEAIHQLPRLRKFKGVMFKLDRQPVYEHQNADEQRRDQGLYTSKNAGNEIVRLSSEAWRVVCSHYFQDSKVDSYFTD